MHYQVGLPERPLSEIREDARQRLIGLVDDALATFADAIRSGDRVASVQLLRSMRILEDHLDLDVRIGARAPWTIEAPPAPLAPEQRERVLELIHEINGRPNGQPSKEEEVGDDEEPDKDAVNATISFYKRRLGV